MTYLFIRAIFFIKHRNISDIVGVKFCYKVSELDWSRSQFKNYPIGVGVKN